MYRQQILWWLTLGALLVSAVGGVFLAQQPDSSYARSSAIPTPTLIVSDRQFLPNVLGLRQGPTATPTTPPPTPTPYATLTPTPEPDILNMGTLPLNQPLTQQIEPFTAHRWKISLSSAETLSLFAIAIQPEALQLRFVQPEEGMPDPVVGTAIRLPELELPAGVTTIELTAPTSAEDTVDYVLLASTQTNSDVAGILHNNEDQSGSLEINTRDLWLFLGREGQSLSFSVVGSPNADAHLELLDPRGQRLLIKDDGGTGQPETLSDFTLPSNGIYTLIVSERDHAPLDYSILTQP